MRTSEALDVYLNSCAAKGLSKDTIRWYKGILSYFARIYPDLPDNPEAIEYILQSCKAGDERKHGYYRALRSFYGFLNRRYNIPNPILLIEPPRRHKKQPKALMPDDINILLNYPHSACIKAAILFLLDTGARLGELAKLQLEDLKETPWGFVATIDGKTGRRIVPLSYETYHALMVNLPYKMSAHWLGTLISRAFKRAGIKGSAHSLRHSFATLWQGDELVLQQIMGHSNLSTTRIYRHLRTELISRQHHQYSPLKMLLSTSKSMF